MTDGPVRFGYVGCGFMAQNVHLPNFTALGGCQVVALAETRPKLARLVAERFGIPRVYRDHRELAEDPEIEAVGVSAAFDVQGEIAADLLRAGKHVFMEKPMALSLAQADRILAAEREGNARLTVAYNKRYDPGNELARATIAEWRASEDKGKVLYARSHCFTGNWLAGLDTSTMITTDEPAQPLPDRFENLPDWMPEDAGRDYVLYLQNWTHNINLLRYLLDTGDSTHVRAVDLEPDGLCMRGVVIFEIDGIRAAMESAVIEHHYLDDHTCIYFERGWVHVHAPPLFVRPTQSRVEIYEGGEHSAFHYPVARPLEAWTYREEAAEFIESVRSGTPTRSGAADTRADVHFFEDVFRHRLGLS